MGDPRRAKLWLALTLTVVTAIGLAACGNDAGDEGETASGAEEAGTTAGGEETGTNAEEGGEPILIKTHVAFLENPTPKAETMGEVLPGSTIGDSRFCPGGKFSDRHGKPPLGLVVKTIRCPGGRLTITFSPTDPSLDQTADWEVVNGSGSFEGLSGGGRMRAVFESRGGEGQETFTGTVTADGGE
jgi:hypothetical protein